LLSAQCTDERVNKITPQLFRRADNPFDMVKLSVEEIKSIIRPWIIPQKIASHIYALRNSHRQIQWRGPCKF